MPVPMQVQVQASQRFRIFLLSMLAVLVGLGLGVQPAAAQNFSPGYKFLKAVEEGDFNTVDSMLKDNGTLINARDVAKGHTALHIAVRRQEAPWIRYLMDKGADANIADKDGVTPLLLASQRNWIEGVELLAGRGANVDIPNSAGETPLITAVHSRNVPMVRVLLKAGADPDRNDNSGRSAREYATQQGRGNATLAEIERSGGEPGSRAKAPSYGPSF